jgi:hypothetical protein
MKPGFATRINDKPIKETTHFIVNNYPYSNRVTVHNWCDVKDEPLSLVTDEYTVAVFHIKPKK